MNKKILGLILAMMVVPITIAPVLAQQSPPINGSVPPNYTFPRVDNPAYQRKLNQVKPAQINAEPILKRPSMLALIISLKNRKTGHM